MHSYNNCELKKAWEILEKFAFEGPQSRKVGLHFEADMKVFGLEIEVELYEEEPLLITIKHANAKLEILRGNNCLKENRLILFVAKHAGELMRQHNKKQAKEAKLREQERTKTITKMLEIIKEKEQENDVF